ncbi:MAG: hypothetical protein AB1634_19460, partial [Thermodesulfobacteriota bacterium]
EGVAMAPDGNIYFHPADYLDDFSQGTLGERAWFIHESTHVWQFQQKMDVGIGSVLAYFTGNTSYLPLESSTTWAALNVEQQANLVRDYYRSINGVQVPGASRCDMEWIIPFAEREF